MSKLDIKQTNKAIVEYFEGIEKLGGFGLVNETHLAPYFANLLRHYGKQFGYTLAEQFSEKVEGHTVRYDGLMLDDYKLHHGVWEAKDTRDDMNIEIKKKFDKGYPKKNIMFQEPKRIVIYQNGQPTLDVDATKPENLTEAIKVFLEFETPTIEGFHNAVEQFKLEIPKLAQGLQSIIDEQQAKNKDYQKAFANFTELCQKSINPNISESALEEMLIQHLLTERLFRTVFNNPDFVRRNAIAAEIEKVIDAMASMAFNRSAFTSKLDRFYRAIEDAAKDIKDWSQMQGFMNTVYEKFFQGFAVKVADTHGIVYTPQPIVSFMVKSVEDILKKEFGRSLSDEGVHILDPFVGTGNFILSVMKNITDSTKLEAKYKNELHCNEVMLLPYYVACMNIEHEFYTRTGKYKPFEGICFVDTFQLAEPAGNYLFSMTEKNTERVENQKKAPIFVIISNPPYNSGQVNQNDNNKNRKYPIIDKRVNETYAKDSVLTNRNALSDPYVKAIRWATDRITKNGEGIVAVVTNNSFIDDLPFDGMRKNLLEEFDSVYIFDLGGNVRKNPKLSGTTHNVFGIQVGVSINLLVKKNKDKQPHPSPLLKGEGDSLPSPSGRGEGEGVFYARLDEYWRKEQKYEWLAKTGNVYNVSWKRLEPNGQNVWLTEGLKDDFDLYTPIGSKEDKRTTFEEAKSLFYKYNLGDLTARDVWVINYNKQQLKCNVDKLIDEYNSHVFRYSKLNDKNINIDEWVEEDPKKISWSRDLKKDLIRLRYLEWNNDKIRNVLYRPYTKSYIYFDSILNQDIFGLPLLFPTNVQKENRLILITIHSQIPFVAQITNEIPEYAVGGRTTQCFPFYTYNEDGTGRRENITDWSLAQFRQHYPSPSGGRCPEGTDEGVLNSDTTQPHPNPLLKGEGEKDRAFLRGEGDNILPPPGEGGCKPDEGVLTWHEYNKRQNLLSYATSMRKDSTDAEKVLWEMLRDRRLLNLKFRRQHVAGDFILDFYCKEKEFAIELDGGQHTEADNADYDKRRSDILQNHGIKVVRFWNNDVLNRLESVMEALYAELADRQPHPNPLLKGEGDNILPPPGEGGRRPDEGVFETDDKQPHPNPLLKGEGEKDSALLRGEGEITKWDIFYYVYAMLHHPGYRGEYKENLRRSLPRIPFAPDFWKFAQIGKQLADLHVNYEKVEPFKLETVQNREVFSDVQFKIKKMKLSADKTQLVYNEAITFTGIPKEVYEYKLGNRSALEWIVDQYQVTTDPKSGITQDPNDFDGDERYIFNLIGRIVAVSLETVKLTNELSALPYKENQ